MFCRGMKSFTEGSHVGMVAASFFPPVAPFFSLAYYFIFYQEPECTNKASFLKFSPL